MSEKNTLAADLDNVLQRIGSAVYRQKNRLSDEIGISRQQLDVLYIVYERSMLTMGELCKEIFSACSTATDLADKLEKAGYVERMRGKKDRRMVRLNILPKGKALVEAVIEKRKRDLKLALEGLGAEEARQATAFLKKLADRL